MNAPRERNWADFRIAQPAACLSLLRDLCGHRVPIALNLPDGSNLPTVLRAVEPDASRLNFSADTDTGALARLVESNEAMAVAYLDQVKLQFDLHGFVLVHGGQSRMLHSALPQAIFRFQRRNAFRVRHGGQPEAVAMFRHPGLPEMALTLRLLDVSIGGCALWLPADVPPLQPGTHLGELQVELDGETRLAVPALLQHVTAIIGEHSTAGVRIGCAWAPLPGPAERVLQRWIDRAQQRQRLLQAP
jgi:c-di-GMP-binding flagellar brake protein YcgR